jgi:hypothetical protein
MSSENPPIFVLIAPPGIKTFSSIQMQTPNPPLGTAYIAAVLKRAGIPCKVIDAVGEGITQIADYKSRAGMKIQGLTVAQVLERIPAEADIIGFSCMFSTLWPITRDLVEAVRAKFPKAMLVLGGEHGTAVPENVLRTSPFDMVVLGEGTETVLDLIAAYRADPASREDWAAVKGIAYRRASAPSTIFLFRIGTPFPSASTSTAIRSTAPTSGARCPCWQPGAVPISARSAATPACGPSSGFRARRSSSPTKWSCTRISMGSPISISRT